MPTRSRSSKDVNRIRPRGEITLSAEAWAGADELALERGLSRSALIETLIREESFRSRLDLAELGRRERKKRGITRRSRKKTD